jgi:hypothetical protein
MGVQMRADSAGGQGVEGSRGVVWGHAAFPKGKAVGEVEPPYAPESCKEGICGGSAMGRKATVGAHRSEEGGGGGGREGWRLGRRSHRW